MTPDPELDALIEAFLVRRKSSADTVVIPVYRATDDIMADLVRRGIFPARAHENIHTK